MQKLLIFFLIIPVFSCSNNETNEKQTITKPHKEITGETLYLKYCKLCHGVDGKLGLSQAADLSISVLTIDESIQVITNGRKGMTPFKDQLSAEQIQEVAKYIETLHR